MLTCSLQTIVYIPNTELDADGLENDLEEGLCGASVWREVCWAGGKGAGGSEPGPQPQHDKGAIPDAHPVLVPVRVSSSFEIKPVKGITCG